MDSKRKNALVKLLLSVVLVLSFSGCATAPVQEMSNARQAIQVAKAVGADEHSQSNLMQAKKLLKKAERALQIGEYKEARMSALAAKEEALQAQQFATVTQF